MDNMNEEIRHYILTEFFPARSRPTCLIRRDCAPAAFWIRWPR